MLATSTIALAVYSFDYKKLAESYRSVMTSCFGKKAFGFLPVHKSYEKAALCTAMLLTCGVAAFYKFGNPVLDTGCTGVIKTLSEKNC